MPYVRDFMTRDIVCIDHNRTALDGAEVMTEKKVSCLVILKDDGPVGMVTERDFLRKLTAKNKSPASVKISSIMSQPLVRVEPDASLKDAVRMMRENNIRRLAVFEDNKLVGIITMTDISKFIM